MNNNILTGAAFSPAIDRAIRSLRPDFVALSIVVRGGRNLASADAPANAATARATRDAQGAHFALSLLLVGTASTGTPFSL